MMMTFRYINHSLVPCNELSLLAVSTSVLPSCQCQVSGPNLVVDILIMLNVSMDTCSR